MHISNTPEAGDAKLIALAESLQKPFDEESRKLKKEIAGTFVPMVNQVKGVYASLERTVDIPFGAGLLLFNDGCKEIEKSTASDTSLLQRVHAEHRVGNPVFFGGQLYSGVTTHIHVLLVLFT